MYVFHFKDRLPYDLLSCIVYKFKGGRFNSSYYGETYRYLEVRSGEHILVFPPLTFKKVKQPSVESSICDDLFFHYSPSFDDFIILTQETNKFLLETKGSLLTKRDKPELNKNSSTP